MSEFWVSRDVRLVTIEVYVSVWSLDILISYSYRLFKFWTRDVFNVFFWFKNVGAECECVSFCGLVGFWGEYLSFTTSWTSQEGPEIYRAETETQVNSHSIQERSAPSGHNKLSSLPISVVFIMTCLILPNGPVREIKACWFCKVCSDWMVHWLD